MTLYCNSANNAQFFMCLIFILSKKNFNYENFVIYGTWKRASHPVQGCIQDFFLERKKFFYPLLPKIHISRCNFSNSLLHV